jgi:hypothetical protein
LLPSIVSSYLLSSNSEILCLSLNISTSTTSLTS